MRPTVKPGQQSLSAIITHKARHNVVGPRLKGGSGPTPPPGPIEFPLFDVYSDAVTKNAGTPVPQSNTRYWESNPAYPVYDSGNPAHTLVTSEAAAQTALNSAVAGDHIFVQDGAYNNFTVAFARNGTAANPIWFGAQTKGGVNLQNTSQIDCQGSSFIDIFGFRWTGTHGTSNGESIEASGSDDVRIAYQDFDGIGGSGTPHRHHWIDLRNTVNRARVCYCDFKNKDSGRSPVRGSQSTLYARVDHNYYADIIGNGADGDFECFQVGESNPTVDTWPLFDNNHIIRFNNVAGSRYFANEREITTAKSRSNIYIQNVVEASVGFFNDRNANQSIYYANWFDGTGIDDWDGGISLGGINPFMIACYIANINALGNTSQAGGRAQDGGGTYERANGAEFAFNTFINCRRSMAFGEGGGGSGNPLNTKIYNNAIDYAPLDTASVGRDNFGDTPTWAGNVFESPSGVTPNPAGITEATPDLVTEGGYQKPTASGNCSNGQGSSAYDALASVDIIGTPINASPHVGAISPDSDMTATDYRQRIKNRAGVNGTT